MLFVETRVVVGSCSETTEIFPIDNGALVPEVFPYTVFPFIPPPPRIVTSPERLPIRKIIMCLSPQTSVPRLIGWVTANNSPVISVIKLRYVSGRCVRLSVYLYVLKF
jgi:hypothetical protein